MADAVATPSRTPASSPPPFADRSTLRLAAVIGGLALAIVAGFGLGRLTDPATSAATGASAVAHTHPPGTAAHLHGDPSGAVPADGLTVSAAGYTLVPETTRWRVGVRDDFRFTIVGPDRKPVTSFAIVHEKPLHMIVVHRDLDGYQHLHPDMAPDGTWRVPLELPRPGVWRVYADFSALDAAGTATPLTLGVDLTVAGDYQPRALAAPARTATVDGFTVTYEGTPQSGVVNPVLFRISRDGAPVTDLEPYLGAYGHLVVLREGDLAYVHVHPEERVVDDGVRFWLSVPGPGRYRMFFDFQLAGVVRTAEFTLAVE